MKNKRQWYANTLKEKEKALNALNNQLATLAMDNEELIAGCARLREGLVNQLQGCSPAQGDDRREPPVSLSLTRKPTALWHRQSQPDALRAVRAPTRCKTHAVAASRSRSPPTQDVTENRRLTQE
jgi:hypothetical protein